MSDEGSADRNEDEVELGSGDLVGDGLEVVGVLGRGGFAIVYEVAREDAPLALKVMKRRHVRNKDTVARFFREAAVIRELSSAHVPTIHDVGELADGRPFILMDRLEGRSLREVLREEGRLEAPRVARIGAQVCEALSAAHALGALHRDLKPANLFLVGEGNDEKVLVLDFGVATFVAGFTDSYGALTKTNAIVGTPHYMSPEQIRAKVLDERSDVYMLGAVLYELITATRPFEGETLGLLLAAVHSGGYAPISRHAPTTPKALVDIVDKALSHEPGDRFASALAMQKALVAAENAPPMLGPRPSRRPTMPAKPRAANPEVISDTPERHAAAESLPAGVRRPPLLSARRRLFVFVLALVAVSGFVFHWLAQPPDADMEEHYDPVTETIQRPPSSPSSSPPDRLPRGVTPPPVQPPPSIHPRMVRMRDAPMETMTAMSVETMTAMTVQMMTETMMEPASVVPSADMRGELLDPFSR